MSQFSKLVLKILGAVSILYFFTCATFSPSYPINKDIDHDKIVEYILEEVSYEIAYGDKNVAISLFVDQAIKDVLSKN